MSSNLPPGWEAKWSAQHSRYYYVNHNTKKTQWTKPEPVVQQTFGGNTGLPTGWEAKWSEQYKRYYYVDHATKKTQWTKPELTSAATVDPNSITKKEFMQGIKQHWDSLNIDGFEYYDILQLLKTEKNEFNELASKSDITKDDLEKAKEVMDDYLKDIVGDTGNNNEADDEEAKVEKMVSQITALESIYNSFDDEFLSTLDESTADEVLKVAIPDVYNSINVSLEPLNDYNFQSAKDDVKRWLNDKKIDYNRKKQEEADAQRRDYAKRQAEEEAKKAEKDRKEAEEQMNQLQIAFLKASGTSLCVPNFKQTMKDIGEKDRQFQSAVLDQLNNEKPLQSYSIQEVKKTITSHIEKLVAEEKKRQEKEEIIKTRQRNECKNLYKAYNKGKKESITFERFIGDQNHGHFQRELAFAMDDNDFRAFKTDFTAFIAKLNKEDKVIEDQERRQERSDSNKVTKPKPVQELKPQETSRVTRSRDPSPKPTEKKTTPTQKPKKKEKKVYKPKEPYVHDNSNYLSVKQYGKIKRIQPMGSNGAGASKLIPNGPMKYTGVERIVPQGPGQTIKGY